MDWFDKYFGAFFIATALIGVVLTGVVIWAIIALVLHFT